MIVPSFKEFTIKQLEKHGVLSEVDLMDMFARKYYTNSFWRVKNYGILAKKLESYRKRLWQFKKNKIILEKTRIRIPLKMTWGNFEANEIFYTLNR